MRLIVVTKSGEERGERAARALARVQTLLGHGSVLTPLLEGGRDPGQRTRLVPWGDERVAVRSPEQPWPGQLPAPPAFFSMAGMDGCRCDRGDLMGRSVAG